MLKGALKQYLIGSLIFLGILSWSLVMVKSGWLYKFGLGFWGPNGHDGIWHVALANNFAKLTFENPVFAGSFLQNYHIGFDVLLALTNKVTSIPISSLYFQILPPIFAVLIGYLTYKLILLWTKSKRASLFSLFFVYFAGSFSWLLGRGESSFWSQQAISTLVNPPFALSLIFVLSGLIFLLKYQKTGYKKYYVLTTIFFGLLIQIKVYAGLLVLGALLVSGNFSIFLGSLLISSLVFFPLNKNVQSVIKWQPFWFLETMMNYSDRLGWQRFYSAMTTYKMGHFWFKETIAYGLAFGIFIIGNFWTRLIFLKDIFKKLDSLKIFMLSIIFAGVLIPMFFVQDGTPWNTIQFVYYSLFFSGILAGIALSKFNAILICVLVVITIPTTYFTLKDVYVPTRPPAMLSNAETEALSFLNRQSDGVVLTYPYDSDKAKEAVNNPPRPLYLYESTAYVSAYSKKTMFLEDEVNLNIMGYDWKNRRDSVEDFFKVKNSEFLKDNNISYIYLVGYQKDQIFDLEKIFENKEVIIYRYAKDFSSN